MSLRVRKFLVGAIALVAICIYCFFPDSKLSERAGIAFLAASFLLSIPLLRQRVRDAGGVLLESGAQRPGFGSDERLWRALGGISTGYVRGRQAGLDVQMFYPLAETLGWVLGGAFACIAPFAIRQAPGPGLLILTCGLAALWVGWFFRRARRMRYVPFRPLRDGDGRWEIPETPIPEIRGSGEFLLGDQQLYLYDLPVHCWITEAGSVVLSLELSYTKTLYGVTVTKAEGTWELTVPPGAIRSVEQGLVYLYGVKRPGLRLTLLRPSGRKQQLRTEQVVLSYPHSPAGEEAVEKLRPLVQNAEPAA